MKEWFVRFWDKHGDRTVFLVAAVVMAGGFMLCEELKETGKTILIGVGMLLFNKARSPDAKLSEPAPKK